MSKQKTQNSVSCAPPPYSDVFETDTPTDTTSYPQQNYHSRQHPPFCKKYIEPSCGNEQQIQLMPQTVVIQQQPSTAVQLTEIQQGRLINPPDDYLGYSIFATVCCCCVIGIYAIIKSAECREAIAAGDRVKAEAKSAQARSNANMAVCLGVVFVIVDCILIYLRINMERRYY